MLKRVDNAVYDAFNDLKTGQWSAGVEVLGLKEEGVGWALDEHNRPLVTDDMRAQVEAAAEKIKSGEIQVHDYMADESCPAAAS